MEDRDKEEYVWMLKSIFGRQSVEYAIRKLCTQHVSPFVISKDKKILIGYDYENLRKRFGPLTEITSLQAYEKFGLKRMEEACEKFYSAV